MAAATSISCASARAAIMPRRICARCSPIPTRVKLYHFARFDLAAIKHYLGVTAAPVYCTKIAIAAGAHLYRPPRPQGPGPRAAAARKSPSSSNRPTGAARCFRDAQKDYAASDVRYLHAMRAELDRRLAREGRTAAGPGLFRFPARTAPSSIWPAGRRSISSRMSEMLPTMSESRGPKSPADAAPGRIRAAATIGWCASRCWFCRPAIGVLGAFLVMAPLFTGGDVSASCSTRTRSMSRGAAAHPVGRYRGEDAKGQPFACSAGSAVQKSSAEPIVQLQRSRPPRSRLPDGPAAVRADQRPLRHDRPSRSRSTARSASRQRRRLYARHP